ncbi:MAG: Uma2 family endonuclease [Acidobacteria bacterium]|nr:Uma2 family endonuclease [Acidobacteriota bacterium]
MSVEIARHFFTVAEYERMGEAGIFPEGARVELIEGEIVEISPIGMRHAACVARLTQFLSQMLQGRVVVWIQNPVRLADYSEPQPDVAVLQPRADFYGQSLPTPADALLVIEVADTTLDYDRQIKVPLYARAGVPEVWIVNLNDERIETYADPVDGAYRTTASAGRGDEVRARGVASLRLSVAEVLG